MIKGESFHHRGHVSNLELTPPLHSLDSSILRLTLGPPSLNRTKNTKDTISTGPKLGFLLHSTTIHPPTIKALQTRKTTKLGSLSLPYYFLTEAS